MIRGQVLEAIVLSQRDFGEADRLLVIFSKQKGKLTILGKGVRRITSRRGGNLDVLNNVILTVSPGQNFYIVTEAQVINSYVEIKSNLSKAFYAYYLTELINVLTVDEQIHLDIYYLLKNTLNLFSETPRRVYILAFEIKLLAALGFWSLQSLVSTGNTLMTIGSDLTKLPLERIGKKQYDEHAIRDLSTIIRKQLMTVAEQEFKSPRIIAKLREQIEKGE